MELSEAKQEEEKKEISIEDIIKQKEEAELKTDKPNIILSVEENPNIQPIDLIEQWKNKFTDSKDFKKHLGKPIKNMNKEEATFYKRLQKREQLEKKKNKQEEKKRINNSSLFDDDLGEANKENINPNNKQSNKNNNYDIKSSDEEEEIDYYVKLELLKSKFGDTISDIEINKNMSNETLKTKYNLAMTMIETKHADTIAYSVFLLLNKCVERTADTYFHTDILDGLSDNVAGMRKEITEVLKEMVQSGEIPIEMLTPQLRLLMIMSGVVIQTIEKNTAKKKVLVEC